MTHRRAPILLLGWALLTPPYGGTIQDTWLCTGCGDPGHLNDGAPLSRWRPLGTYPDQATCQKARGVFIDQSRGDDEKWADMELSRCFTDERVGQGRLRPGE